MDSVIFFGNFQIFYHEHILQLEKYMLLKGVTV